MTGLPLTASLRVVGGTGLAALVITEGLAGDGRDDDHEQIAAVALARPAEGKAGS